MLERQRRTYQVTLLAGDLAVLVLTVLVAILIRIGSWHSFIHGFKSVTVLCCVSTTALFYIADLYDVRQDPRTLRTAVLLSFNVALGVTLVALAFYLFPSWRLGRGIFLLIFFVGSVLVIAWRLVYFHYHSAVSKAQRICVIGSSTPREELKQLAMEHGFELIPVGACDAELPVSEGSAGDPDPANGVSTTHLHFSKPHVDAIVLAPSFSPGPQLTRELIRARFSGVAVFDWAGFVQSVSSKLPVDHIDEGWFLSAYGFHLFESNVALRVKRLIDVTLALILLVLSLPLLPLIALGIKMSSRGPVFYFQERVGQGEKVFRLVKFRSMVSDSEPARPVWALRNDPRTFVFGRLLRLFHLDEIPQVLNIIRGEMSFVGPRPERPAFVEKLRQVCPHYSLRSTVRPGLTGWAQVNYPYGASVEDAMEKLKYDLFYIRHVSWLLDLKIILKTVRKVFFREGSR